MKTLDFLVIGAQKCATTTLFELLRQHPDIHMPLEKEVPFFHRDDCGADAWREFAARNFGPEDGRLWGKATPQYMGDAAVPARIAAQMPGVRMIAVLRDPLERSRSHFRMAVRRGTEERCFETAMRELLSAPGLAAGREGSPPRHTAGYESEAAFYLAWSEYGRILAAYREHFPASQLLVLTTDELENTPAATLRRILKFLDIGGEFTPRGLGEHMHAGGGSNRVPHGLRVWLRERTLVSALWRRVPAQLQGRLRFLYERWNTRSEKAPLPLPPALEQELRMHFARDTRQLLALGLPCPPWAGSYPLGWSSADAAVATRPSQRRPLASSVC